MSKSTSDPLLNIHRNICGSLGAAFLAAIIVVSPMMKDEDGAHQKLDDAHYTEINITGGRWLGSPFYRNTCFEACNENGEFKTGYVSQSLINKKTAMIRLDH